MDKPFKFFVEESFAPEHLALVDTVDTHQHKTVHNQAAIYEKDVYIFDDVL